VSAVSLIAALSCSAVSSFAAPVVVDFDDIPTPNCGIGADPVPGGYGGFIWSAFFFVECDADYQTNSGNSTGAPSPANAAYNGFAELQLTIWRDLPFAFNGGMFSGWAYVDAITEGFTATDITISGYLGDEFIGTTELQSLNAMYASISGFEGYIDRLEFYTTGNTWLMDDLQYTPAPEPASLLLLGAGLLGGLALRRRARARRVTQMWGPPSGGPPACGVA
jgi:hypothetical protein